MPTVGNRNSKKALGQGYSKDPIVTYAASFLNTAQNILNESSIDIFIEPHKAMMMGTANDALRNFFTEEAVDPESGTAEEIQDETEMFEEQYNNNREALLEHTGQNTWNPVIGLAFPIHKNILMNNVFDKGAIPKVVAQEPKFTISMETRMLITPDGREIDMFKEQYKMRQAIDDTVPFREFIYPLPTTVEDTANLLPGIDGIGGIDNISIETYISAITFADDPAAAADDEWFPVRLRFAPAYGEYDRTLMEGISVILPGDTEPTKDVISGYMQKNLLAINSMGGNVKGVKVSARLDTSSATVPTCSVMWKVRTDIIEIPSAIPINTTIAPEEVKDVGALYQVNHLSKIMSLIKLAIGNYKDDKIKEHLDESFILMPDTNKLARTFDFAPRPGYALDHVEWRYKTFMDAFDTHVTNLLQVLNDPNMVITVFGRPDLIRKITPTEYSYQSPDNIGPVDLDYCKTVTTSDRRTYQFISSDKLRGNNNLIIILCPRNTERIIYRIYDYQMYVSNEIRNIANPALPAIHAFERWKFVEYQPVQARIKILNPTGLTTVIENEDPIGSFTMNDFNSDAPYTG